MPTFEFEANGRTFEVDAPDARSAMAAFGQAMAPPTTGQQEPAFDPMGNATGAVAPQVASPTMPYRQQMENVGRAVDSGVRQFAKGTPFIGSYLDEMNAATRAGMGQGNYAENLQAERGRDQQFENAHPQLSTGLQIAGGVASGGALMKAMPGVSNFAFGNAGTALPTRMLAGSAAGAAAGGTYGFGAGEGDMSSRLDEAGKGAAIGGVAGGVIPGVIGGVKSVANALVNRGAVQGAASELGVPVGSVKRVAKNLADDEMNASTATARASEIGPEGMVLDMGRQTLGRAEAVASMPGKGQNRVLNSVEDRVKNSSERVGQQLDSELGQSRNLVELEKKIGDFYDSKAKPAYDKVMSDNPTVWDDQLQRLTRRPSVARAIDDAVTLAKEHGDDVVSPFVRNADGELTLKAGASPNLRFWDYVKKSLDSRVSTMARNPDPDSAGKATYGALLDTKRALVQRLDELTGDSYKQARNIAADKFRVKEALETGTKIFENRMLPEQFAEHIGDMGQVERLALAAGARRALERIRENASANMSDGGRQVYRELLQGGPNGDTAQKLRMLLGDDPASSIIKTAQREANVFEPAYQRVAANSRTTPRAEAVKDMQPMSPPDTFTSGINRAAAAPFKAMLSGMVNHGNERTREGIADLLTRSGTDRDKAVDIMLSLNRGRDARANNETRDALTALMLAPSGAAGERAPDIRPKVRRMVGGQR